MLYQAALRRPRVIGARDQIAVDRPDRGLVQRIQHLGGAGAGQAETDRNAASAAGYFLVRHRHQPLEFAWPKATCLRRTWRPGSARRPGRAHSAGPAGAGWARRVRRCETASPGAATGLVTVLQPALQIGCWLVGHRSISLGLEAPETGPIKNPVLAAGFRDRAGEQIMARVDLGSPAGDLFSTTAMRTNS